MADLYIHMHYTYVLWSEKSKKFYIGYTSDLKRRLSEHRHGKSHATVRMGSLKLVFYEGFISKADALRREDYFKTTKGKKSLRLIVRNSINIKESDIIKVDNVVPIV